MRGEFHASPVRANAFMKMKIKNNDKYIKICFLSEVLSLVLPLEEIERILNAITTDLSSYQFQRKRMTRKVDKDDDDDDDDGDDEDDKEEESDATNGRGIAKEFRI